MSASYRSPRVPVSRPLMIHVESATRHTPTFRKVKHIVETARVSWAYAASHLGLALI